MKLRTSNCSACHAADKTLSRCSQCKWTAYCSKACQRSHWGAGHRQMCAKLKVCQRFRDLELQWWATRPTDELQMYVNQFGLQPESMCFFGEVLFLLCGLKACVLLSNLPPTWRQSFAYDVVFASGLQSLTGIALYSVSIRLGTPADSRTSPSTSCLESRCTQLPVTDGGVSELVHEHELARVLDYPVALSECNEAAPMVEVGYFLEKGQERVLLTSYYVMATPQHTQRVQQHFQRYRSCSGGLQLTLGTSQI